MIKLKDILDYYPGKGCRCAAHDSSECGCNVDWSPKMEKLIKYWYKMPAQEMRLLCGELTAQEIRTVRAVLAVILRQAVKK
jgi:hypothetical protein